MSHVLNDDELMEGSRWMTRSLLSKADYRLTLSSHIKVKNPVPFKSCVFIGAASFLAILFLRINSKS